MRLRALTIALVLAASLARAITLPCAAGDQCVGGGACPGGEFATGLNGNCTPICSPLPTTTTVTTTTSTSTTSTTLATGASTTHLWFPYPNPSAVSNWAFSLSGANVMLCWAWVPPTGMTSFTKTAWNIVNNAGGGATCGAAIYNAAGTTRIMTTGGVACVVDTIATTGISAWSLTAGTKYQVCFCPGQTGGSVATVDPGGDRIRKIGNAFTVPLMTRAGNACVGGAPPTTTGTLTAETGTNAYTPIILFGAE